MSTIAAIQSAAIALATARAKTEVTSAEFEQSCEREMQIASRIDILDSKRDQIIGRRQRGDQKPDDGVSLALIAADREGLAPLLRDAKSATAEVRNRCLATQSFVDAAVLALQQVEDQKSEADLIEHARRLDTLLLETVQRFNVVRKRVWGGTAKWGPSKALALELRKLQAERNEL
jgi:hypothetical protein